MHIKLCILYLKLNKKKSGILFVFVATGINKNAEMEITKNKNP